MPRRAARHHHHVYVVELSDGVWNEPSFRKANPDYRLGKPFVYVGMTGLDPDLRFDKHKAGIQANRFVREYGLRLLPQWSSRSACARRASACGRPETAGITSRHGRTRDRPLGRAQQAGDP